MLEKLYLMCRARTPDPERSRGGNEGTGESPHPEQPQLSHKNGNSQFSVSAPDRLDDNRCLWI
jgi:hypothetical protein